MFRTLARGAAAALFAATISTPLAAQAAGGGRARITTGGDSVVVRAIGVGGRIDTVTAIVRALQHEQYGSPVWLEMTRRLDSLMLSSGRIMFRSTTAGGFGAQGAMTRGWIGFIAQGPQHRVFDSTGDRITYFAYPSILSVDPTSPADKAGIVPGDVLIAFNGTDVVGHEFNLTRLFEPEKKVGVTIRRDGENRDYSLDVVKAPETVFNRRIELNRMPGGPVPPMIDGQIRVEVRAENGEKREGVMRRMPSGGSVIAMPKGAMGGPFMSGGFAIISPHGVLGANVSPVGSDLAKVLKLEKGILVNEVPEKSPAFKAGLRAGDVIISALGQPVSELNDLQDLIMSRFGDRSISLQIVRDRKPSKITITW
jgi:serine protease Do